MSYNISENHTQQSYLHSQCTMYIYLCINHNLYYNLWHSKNNMQKVSAKTLTDSLSAIHNDMTSDLSVNIILVPVLNSITVFSCN